MLVEKKRPHDHHDQRHQEHKYGNAVDPMHILYPSAARCIGIFLLNVKVFRYLSPYAHIAKIFRSTPLSQKNLTRFLLQNPLYLPSQMGD